MREDIVTTRVAKDTAFLREVAKVFAKYPGVKHRYALASLAIPLEMGIDFDKQIGVCRSEGDKVVIEFQDRGEDSKLRMRHCDVQNEDGTCQAWSGELAE